MREIKFRVWRYEDNKMHEVCGVHLNENGVVSADISLGENFHITNPYQIMQYTGLKDKNDKEIYEGDIIEWKDILDGETQRVAIEWSHTGFDIPIYDNDIRSTKVIGNIYENPEMIK